MDSSSWECCAVRSERIARLIGLALGVSVLVGCALAGADMGAESPDVPRVTVLPPEDWRPPSPFIAGTSLIALQQPLRCHRYPLDATQVAFTWTPSGQRRVYIAIFDEAPARVDSVLTLSPIWTWISGDSRSDVGRLHWADGVPPGPRDLPDWDADVPALTAGTYYFVLWAWDESRNVVASSEARRFMVGTLGASQSPLAYCCEKIGQGEIKIACAPELPPEVAACPTLDSGSSENWPCYCDLQVAGGICQ